MGPNPAVWLPALIADGLLATELPKRIDHERKLRQNKIAFAHPVHAGGRAVQPAWFRVLKWGYRSRSQRVSLAHTLLLIVDAWCSGFGLDSSLHLAVENQRMDAAMGTLDDLEAAKKHREPPEGIWY
jgi:hypothetical protein